MLQNPNYSNGYPSGSYVGACVETDDLSMHTTEDHSLQ